MSFAIIDLETDSTDPRTAKIKFYGAMDYNGKVIIYSYKQKTEILNHLRNTKYIVGFNIKNYDRVVLENNYNLDLKYKVFIDLYEALAPRGDNGFGMKNKNRLHDINPGLQLPNYKLKTIVKTLGLNNEGKGDIDYEIFKKNEWTNEELKDIKKYLKQDLQITLDLFKWYLKLFKPLENYMSSEDVRKFKHLTSTSGVLSYKVMCNLSDLQEEYTDYETSRKLKQNSPRIEGGHHIHPRWEKVKGDIICRDFVSHYPTTLIMYNLLPKNQQHSLQKILTERIDAKINGNKELALALKVPLNATYGTLGNPTFKNIYNPNAALDCTRIGRELLKRYAKFLDVAGFISLYGFTDSVFVGIPKYLSQKSLEILTNSFIEIEKSKAPNPIDTFNLGIDKIIKFMWFIEKKDNNYLWVDSNSNIGIKGGLFDKNTPKGILQLFEKYITPKIINELDIKFTEEELLTNLKIILKNNLEFAAEEYSTKPTKNYKTETSIHYQISSKYGPGKHLLIPNTSELGVGRNKNLKYCSIEEFRTNNLNIDNIYFEKMLKYIKPFFTTKEEVLDLNTIQLKSEKVL